MNRLARIFTMAVLLSTLGALNACSRNADQNDARSLASAITGGKASSAAATSKVCQLLSRAEVSAALGAAVDAVADWSYGGCEWRAGDKAVQVQIAAARDWEPRATSSGAKRLSGIGKAAFVGPEWGDFLAGALTESSSVYVSSPTADVSVKLLRQIVARMTLP